MFVCSVLCRWGSLNRQAEILNMGLSVLLCLGLSYRLFSWIVCFIVMCMTELSYLISMKFLISRNFLVTLFRHSIPLFSFSFFPFFPLFCITGVPFKLLYPFCFAHSFHFRFSTKLYE